MGLAYNQVMIMGTLTRDPIMRTVGSNNTRLATLCMCINEKRKTPDGKVIDNPVFVDVDAWSRLAEICEKYLKKHSLVFVDGVLQMAQWEKDGVKHQKIKIRAKNLKFLSKPERASRRKEQADGAQPPQDAVKETETYVPEALPEEEPDDGFESAMSGW